MVAPERDLAVISCGYYTIESIDDALMQA